jgi:DMSO/TMAO reductase YedYZ molybdopterin-dependent catalytic subunit
MKEDQHRFLSLLGQLPARLTAEQAAWVLNCQPHDVPVLVAARLLKPLGSPMPNSVKYFATLDLLDLVKDRSWLAKVTNAVGQHWREKNASKTRRESAAVEVAQLAVG